MASSDHNLTPDLLNPLNPPKSHSSHCSRPLPSSNHLAASFVSLSRPRLDRSHRPDPQVFGHIAGVSLGQQWATRAEASQAGVHAPFQGGISGSAQRGGAESIVLNGGYLDGDCGDIIWYMGSGGFNHPITGKKSSIMVQDQLASSSRNRAMQQSLHSGLPVRVVRGADDTKSPWAPTSGYRYDGLYKVTHAASINDPTGRTPHTCLVWRMERVISSSYTIPIKTGYEARALEKARIGQQRKSAEDHIAAQGSNSSEINTLKSHGSTPHPCRRESTSHQPRFTKANSDESKKSDPSSNRHVKPHTTRQPTRSPLPPTKPSTNYLVQGTEALGMREALKQMKFSHKRPTFGTPDSPNVLSPQLVCTSIAPIESATASPSASSSSPFSHRSREPSSPPSFVCLAAIKEPNSPPVLSPRDITSITSSTFVNTQLPVSLMSPIQHCEQSSCTSPPDLVQDVRSSITAPLSPTPFEIMRTHSPVPVFCTGKSDVDMEVDSILSPLPPHDFTAAEYEDGVPISEYHLERASNFDEDEKYDKAKNMINNHPSCGVKPIECDIEPSIKLEMEEDELESYPISNSLPINSPVDTHDIVVQTDMSIACEVEQMQISTIDSSSDQKFQVNGLPMEHKLIYHDTSSPLDNEQNNNIPAFNLYSSGPLKNISFNWLDNNISKDQLDGTPIVYNEAEQKYLVGVFELMDIDEEDDDIDQLDGQPIQD